MKFTDIFIQRPVLATVVSLMILVLGLRSIGSLSVREYPFTENAVVTVSTTFYGADPGLVAGFITTPLENSIAQANGIDYMTSVSTQNTSTIQIFLRLNYESNKAVSEINTKVNAVLNQLPPGTLQPVISVQSGEAIDSMYIGFYSKLLSSTQVTDYLLRIVQPKLQSVAGVQNAEIIGERQFAMRAWLDPIKLAGFGVTSQDVSDALANNDFVSAVGRTDGTMVTLNMNATTNLQNPEQFRRLIIRSQNGAFIRLGDVARVDLGSDGYDSSVLFDGQMAVYIGIKIVPSANLLTVLDNISTAVAAIEKQLPNGLYAKIVYDASKYVHSSVHEVVLSLVEALAIVTLVIFLFLGSVRSVIIPVVAIPLSLIGAFFMMLLLGYTINLLTLLALVLAIGLVVDDAIIVVENVYRHMEEGMSRYEAAIIGARELANPIIAISVVLIAVYVPIGFMGGLTGALFTEFAFTLAGAVAVSAIIALTLSPMMCSRTLRTSHNGGLNRLVVFIDDKFEKLRLAYQRVLSNSLNNLSVIVVFAVIVLSSIYFLYTTSKTELAPPEDQGIIITSLTGPPNASLAQTEMYSNMTNDIYRQYSETDHTFQLNGISGLNTAFVGMGLKPWDQRTRTAMEIMPLLQGQIYQIPGTQAAAFMPAPLPGAGIGLPLQFVINTTDPYDKLNQFSQTILAKARASGLFGFIDTDLKIDKTQTTVVLDRDKAAEFGLTMKDLGNILSANMSEGYINYFDLMGRSYRVIPQVERVNRLNDNQLLNYYIKTASGVSIPISTVAHLVSKVVPESINHFQQLNSATLAGVLAPGVTMGQAVSFLDNLARQELPKGYNVDYANESRQYHNESSTLVITFFLAIIIIFLTLAALFESFRDPLIILVSVPMSVCGALVFINLGLGGASLNIYTEVGIVTLIGLISKHGILIVQFANDLQREGKSIRHAIETAASIRLRPILMTTASMVFGVIPLILASGAGAVSRYNIGLVIATGISIGTLFTLFVVPAMYLLVADKLKPENAPEPSKPMQDLK